MKKIIGLLVLSLALCFSFCYAAEEKVELKTQKDKISYSIGLDIGKSFKTQSIDIDSKILMKGLKDGMAGDKTLMTDQEMQETMMAFQKEMMAKQEEKQKASMAKNKTEGDAYLEENKKKEGVTVLPSGLQYNVITEGKGEKPKATDTVEVHYRGTLLDGKEFDSSYSRNQTAKFAVNSVIPGWTEALQLMPVGSKWRLVIPSNLAYGERGAGEMIGPGAVLIFEVELISIQPPASPTK